MINAIFVIQINSNDKNKNNQNYSFSFQPCGTLFLTFGIG